MGLDLVERSRNEPSYPMIVCCCMGSYPFDRAPCAAMFCFWGSLLLKAYACSAISSPGKKVSSFSDYLFIYLFILISFCIQSFKPIRSMKISGISGILAW